MSISPVEWKRVKWVEGYEDFFYHLEAMGRIRSLLVASIMRAITSTSCQIAHDFQRVVVPTQSLFQKMSINKTCQIGTPSYVAHPFGILALISTLP